MASSPDVLRLRSRLTVRGTGALVIGLLAVVTGQWWHYPGLTVLGAGLVVLPLISLGAVRFSAPVLPSREIAPLEVPRHGACAGRLTVASTGRFLSTRLDSAERLGDTEIPVGVPRLAPKESVTARYAIPTAERGIVRVGPLRLRRVGPIGLAAATGSVGAAVEVHVLPRVLPVRGLPGGARRTQVGAEERVEQGGTDLVSLREYVPGDDLRRLHWATSARTGMLMVREDADPARPHLVVLIDDRSASYLDGDLEEAVEVAASLTAVAIDGGYPVRVMTVSGSLATTLPAAPAGMSLPASGAVFAALAEMRAAGEVAELARIPARDLDVVAVVTGDRADLVSLLTDATHASVAVALVANGADEATVGMLGNVVVLSAARAEALLFQWDTAVLR